MRIRFQADFTQPPLKAWFNVGNAATISELKRALITGVKGLQDARAEGSDLVLLLDDFEVLDESPIDVLREGELICLRQSTPSVSTTTKRKSTADDAEPAQKRRKSSSSSSIAHMAAQLAPKAASSSSDSDSSEDDFSSSDSDSGSESGSDSDSDSDSTSSSSSSDSPPRAVPISKVPVKPPPVLLSTQKPLPQPASASVKATVPAKTANSDAEAMYTPPGLGTAQTHKRNERRKRKRQYDHTGAEVEADKTPAAGVFTANQTPLGPRPITAQPSSSSTSAAASRPQTDLGGSTTYMMSSFSNKNKRRGYKEAPAALPAKIVFGDAAQPPAAVAAAALTTPSVPATPAVLPRLVPPSERQERGEIPADWNLFVTSVDVEEGLDTRRKGKGKKRKTQESGWDQGDYQEPAQFEDAEAEAPIILDYGQVGADFEAGEGVTGSSTARGRDVNWAAIENRFPNLPVLSSAQPGELVAWKALDINPATFTPEILLHVARVMRVDGPTVVIKPVPRPEARPLSFGAQGDEAGDIMDIDEEELEVEWQRVLTEEWRLVSP